MVIASANNQIDQRCRECFVKGFERMLAKFSFQPQKEAQLREFFNNTFSDMAVCQAPYMQQILNQGIKKISGIEDLYIEEKTSSNAMAAKAIEGIKSDFIYAGKHFEALTKLAIAGNVMDYGAFESFDLSSAIIKALNTEPAINQTNLLFEKVQKAEKILYLGDNAGEIAFDKLFIETCMSDKVVFVSRKKPILNDVTIKDAEETVMTRVAKVISNGFDAPSTILSRCSSEFLDYYKNADLIISKGQGNLEALIDQDDERLFFLLMVKCDVIAERLNVEKNSFIVMNSTYEY